MFITERKLIRILNYYRNSIMTAIDNQAAKIASDFSDYQTSVLAHLEALKEQVAAAQAAVPADNPNPALDQVAATIEAAKAALDPAPASVDPDPAPAA